MSDQMSRLRWFNIKSLYVALKFIYRKYRYSRAERNEIGFAKRMIRHGMTVIDVGSNKGGYSSHFAELVGPIGRVVCIEPQPVLAEYLKYIVTLLSWSHVLVLNVAVSNFVGKTTLYVPEGGDFGSPGASLKNIIPNSDSDQSSYEVDVTTLDQLCENLELEPDFIKIDVEGLEGEVLLGAEEILTKYHPALLLEIEERHTGKAQFESTFEYLADLGYEAFFYDADDKLLNGSDFCLEIHQSRVGDRFWDCRGYCNNFMFIHKSASSSW